MEGINLDKEDNSSATLTHEEILKLIDEIKRFENNFSVSRSEEEDLKEFIEVDPEIKTNELEFIEVKHENLDDKIEFAPIDYKINKSGLKEGIKKILKSKIKEKPSSEFQKKNIASTTFKIRLNDEGNLVNLDIKKAEPKPESTKRFNLPNLKIIKNKAKKESKEKKSMVSKLKGGLVHVGKLKKVIPFRRESGEETEESELEEEE